MTEKNTNRSSTAIRALQILETVAAAQDPVAATDVANLVGIDKSTAYRMLVTLVEAGYVLRDNASKRYRLSYKVVSLSRNLLSDNETSGLIRDTMCRISQDTSETAHLSVLEGNEAIIVSKVKGKQILAVDYHIGDHFPLHNSTVGKALLAFQDKGMIDRILAKNQSPSKDDSTRDPAIFKKELQGIRSLGYACDDTKENAEIRCVAVPVFECNGVVDKAISISGPGSRLSHEKMKNIRDTMIEHSWNLSKKLGGVPGII